ncbi:MAG: glycosyltransferase [Candidatus Eremiobacteraeota bacterium]|nr:glycosyltransferase [Candidatus Eremiobacteraeota bacterium]
MQTASVVIATRNRAALLDNCLASLQRQSAGSSFEVVVVDNGSTDATSEVIARHAQQGMDVRTTRVAEPNRAKARNAGIRLTRGELTIFCDDDTLAPLHFVASHISSHPARGGAVVAGPIIDILDPADRVAPAARHYSRAYFCTCNASVAKADLEAVGGFDERYDLYGWEDTDLGIRLRARGLRRTFSWQAFIYHIKPPSSEDYQLRRELAREKGKMAARFVRKAPTWPVRLATGAYGLNFLRASLVGARPLRLACEKLMRSPRSSAALRRLARETLLDAAYIDALRAGLRSARG